MGKANKTKSLNSSSSSYTEFFYKTFCNILPVLVPLTIISAIILSLPHSSARVFSSDSLAISVPSSCTLSSSVDEAHSASIVNGRYEEGIGTTTLSTFCNDKNGYSVYAIGDSLNSEGNNALVSNINNNYDIPSGTATSGDTSNWAMKLSLKTGDNSTTPPTVISPFNNYTAVPTGWTRVATIPASTTDMVKGSNFTTTYATYISPTQAAGTYLGQVKYLLTHPSSTTPANAYVMQNIANWENDLGEEESVQATDVRDGKKYWVTKLKDGHIWMTQNLDFDLSANNTLDSTTTDLNVIYDSATGNYSEYNDGYTVNNDIIYWTPASTATTIAFEGDAVTGWQNSNTEPYSASKIDSAETGHASLGNYYNWTATVASNDSSSLMRDTLNNISNNPKNSICPKGWRLPTISNQPANDTGSTNEFARLYSLYGNFTVAPLYYIYSGFVLSSSLNSQDSRAMYSSSTLQSAVYMYVMELIDKTASVQNRHAGWSIRCVAR